MQPMSEPKHSFLQSLFPKHAQEVADSMSERWPMEQDIAGVALQQLKLPEGLEITT